MQLKEIFKPALPHLAALALFTVLSFAYFYPVLEGKVLKANDSMVSKINSKEINDYREKYGKEPLWTNSIFGGMPAYLISTRYPGNLIKKVDTFLRVYGMPVSVLFLSMAGFYLMMLIFGAETWLAITGALAFGFSSFSFQILAAGHNTQAIALAYVPPMIGAIWYTYRKDMIKGALLTALILALELQANHPQVTYYAFLCLLLFGIVELFYAYKNKTIADFAKRSAVLVAPFIIALGINFAFLYTTYEYGKYSIRGKSDLVSQGEKPSAGLDKEYITHWSYGVGETFNLLIPNFKGGSSKPFDRESATVRALRSNNAADAVSQLQRYWGTQPGTDGPHYFGAIVIFLFVLGLIIVKGPERWWLLSATILSIMLSWGKNFMILSDIFIDIFPGYNKFRAVTMILVIAQFTIPLLGMLALRDIFKGSISNKDLRKGVQYAAAITGGFLLLSLVMPGIAGSFLADYETDFPDWLKTALISDRKELLRIDALRSLIFIIASAGALWAFISGKLKKEYALLIIGFLILADLWSVDKRYLNADRFEMPASVQKTFSPGAADSYILKDPSQSRVLNLTVSTFNDNSPTSYFHQSVGGYHGAKMERYQELIDSVIFRDINLLVKAKSIEEIESVFRSTPALNMLNTKYVIYNPDAAPVVNTHALGNAWFVEKPLIAENANAEISAIKKLDPRKEAVIDKRFASMVNKASYPVSSGDTIELTSYKADELVYKYSAADEKLIVFSEIYYPAGWKCFIDGRESSYFRADYTLRAMIAPAGHHEIKFEFRPASYYTGNKVSLSSSLLLILLIAGYLGYDIVKKRKA